MTHLEKACESVDAFVFNGDMLFDDAQRAMLKDYLDRWNHAVSQHEGRADPGRVLSALQELAAVVRGECPALLDKDRGGCARLSIEIDECVKR